MFTPAPHSGLVWVSRWSSGLSPSTALYTSRRVISSGGLDSDGEACPRMLVISPALRREDIICLTKDGFVLTLSAILSLVRPSGPHSDMSTRMCTASLTLVEYFVRSPPFGCKIYYNSRCSESRSPGATCRGGERR